ncbi:hypothetical protein BGW80DRAFT_1444710 [Lactifluus volemus]|nr:hypothetical protein BGW80DRAFT_1444710 [Lactifluus volemus]
MGNLGSWSSRTSPLIFFTLLVLAGRRRCDGVGPTAHHTRRTRYAKFWRRMKRCFARCSISANATWPTRMFRLLPDAARRHEQDVGTRIRLRRRVGWLG